MRKLNYAQIKTIRALAVELLQNQQVSSIDTLENIILQIVERTYKDIDYLKEHLQEDNIKIKRYIARLDERIDTLLNVCDLLDLLK